MSESEAIKAEHSQSAVTDLYADLEAFATAYVSPSPDAVKMSDATRRYIQADNERHAVVADASSHFASDQAKRELSEADKSAYWAARVAKAIVTGDKWERLLADCKADGRKLGSTDILFCLQNVVSSIQKLEKIVHQADSDVLLAVYKPVFERRLAAGVKGTQNQLRNLAKTGNLGVFEDVLSALRKSIRQARKIQSGEPPDKDVVLTLQAIGGTAVKIAA